MNEALKKYAAISEEMVAHLKQGIIEENSDNDLKKLEDYFNARDQLITSIQPPTTDEEKELGQHIMQLNEEIEKRTKALYASVKVKMNQMKKQQHTSHAYANPYDGFSIDGTFYDERN